MLKKTPVVFFLLLSSLLAGCAAHMTDGGLAWGKQSPDYTDTYSEEHKQGKNKGDDNTEAQTKDKKVNSQASKKKNTTVNSSKMTDYDYLWMGALASLSFLKINIADKNAGLITTGWYESTLHPGERFMVNLMIIKGVKPSPASYRVTVRKQIFNDNRWMDATFDHRFEYQIAKKIYNKSKKIKATVRIGV